jgi:hypothetical protein
MTQTSASMYTVFLKTQQNEIKDKKHFSYERYLSAIRKNKSKCIP